MSQCENKAKFNVVLSERRVKPPNNGHIGAAMLSVVKRSSLSRRLSWKPRPSITDCVCGLSLSAHERRVLVDTVYTGWYASVMDIQVEIVLRQKVWV